MEDHLRIALQQLFTRPSEPIIMPKGEQNVVIFNVPDSYLTDNIRNIKNKIVSKFESLDTNRVTIEVQNVALPDISIPAKLPINGSFSLFISNHADMAAKLVDIFMSQRTIEDLIAVAVYCHDRLNPCLFNYCLYVAILHRKDTRNVEMPSYAQSFPGKFVNSSVFASARREAVIVAQEDRAPIVLSLELTANSKEPEQRLAFFREDIGINLHHWHWHLVYPTRALDNALVAKDRRGELFYYMHQQIVARYNAERFAFNMERVKNLESWRNILEEGYFPKLERLTSSRAWASRFRNAYLSDINRPEDQISLKISDMETWEKNIMDAIEKGTVQNAEGKKSPLTIDILGNMVEASMLSPNRTLYGNYHNMGHVLIALCHDPDGRFMENISPIGDTATSMRDPAFYRLHSKINDIFISHKDKLPSYGHDDLEYRHVYISDAEVLTKDKPSNELHTFWQQSDIDLSRGLDFVPRGPVMVRFTHLQHEEFNYRVKVVNSSSKQLNGMMRIFLGPKYDDKGNRMGFDDHRKLMIELDKFKVTLKSGENVIERKSMDSVITIPYDRTFRDLDTNRPTDAKELRSFNFCGCGWPQHMLIPKGNEKGMEFKLFVMVSDYEKDKIVQDITGFCNDAESFCGIQDNLYPDKRSMGYPFDRVSSRGIHKLADFLTPNMITKNVTIKFANRTVLKIKETPKEPVVVSAKKA